MSCSSHESSCDVFSDEAVVKEANSQIILNYQSEETVRHALILLEGEIKPVANAISSDEIKLNTTEDTSNLDGQKFPSSEPIVNEILVYHKESCYRWPVVERRFKAFVKLDRGLNLLKIQFHALKIAKELILCYEKQEKRQRFVRIIYIKCSDSDGSFDAPENTNNSLNIALQKLRFNTLLLQTFMAVEMNRHGFDYQTFELEENDVGEVIVHVFTSDLTTEKAHQMNGDQLYSWFLSELTSSSLNDPHCKFLAFMSCSHYDPPEDLNPKDIPQYVKAHTALGGGQLGLFGTAGLHTWAGEVGQLVGCFTDSREIDKKKLFDDSAGRGTFWANYSTTLGAALHELGHCFDLMHMPEGIMGRGFDDMSHFVLMTSSKRHCVPPAESTILDTAVPRAIEMFADHRAHWFRSSAVLLHYHKWLRQCTGTVYSVVQPCLQVNWSHQVKGPIGNGNGAQKNQSYFNDQTWQQASGHKMSGYVVYHGEYINALVPLVGASGVITEGRPVYGKIDKKCSVHAFILEKEEYLTSLEIRAGAWIDGIRFHSNMKSSTWFGGQGGVWYPLAPSSGGCITGLFGTFGDFLGSLGIRFSKRKYSNPLSLTSTPTIQSDLGLALIELRHEDELINFWEFVQCDIPPIEFSLPLSWLEAGVNPGELSLMIVDINGYICRSSFVGYDEFRKDGSIGYSQERTDEKLL